MTQEKKSRERKLWSIKQRIAKLRFAEQEEVRDWLATKLKDGKADLVEEWAAAIRAAPVGERVVVWLHIGKVAKPAKKRNKWVLVEFEEPIPSGNGSTKRLWINPQPTGLQRDGFQLLDRLPGYGQFEVRAESEGVESKLLGKTPLFTHALYWAFEKVSPALDFVIESGKERLLVTSRLRAQYHMVRTQLGSEIEFSNRLSAKFYSWQSIIVGDRKGPVESFKKFMAEHTELLPEELR